MVRRKKDRPRDWKKPETIRTGLSGARGSVCMVVSKREAERFRRPRGMQLTLRSRRRLGVREAKMWQCDTHWPGSWILRGASSPRRPGWPWVTWNCTGSQRGPMSHAGYEDQARRKQRENKHKKFRRNSPILTYWERFLPCSQSHHGLTSPSALPSQPELSSTCLFFPCQFLS